MNYNQMSKDQLIAELKRRDKAEPTGKYKFTFEAGILLASSMESQIKNLAFRYGLECSIEKEQIFLSINHRVVVRGIVSKLESFKLDIERYQRQLERAG